MPDPRSERTDSRSLCGLHPFAERHLLGLHVVLAAASSGLGVLDLVAPCLGLPPIWVYGSTSACLLSLLVTAPLPARGRPQWRRVSWQGATLVLTVVSALGWATVVMGSPNGGASRCRATTRGSPGPLDADPQLGIVKLSSPGSRPNLRVG